MTHHGTPLKRMGLDLADDAGRRAADGLRRAAAALPRAGTSASPPTASRPRSGSASTRRLRVARRRLPAQRRARRRRPATTRSGSARELGIEPGQVAVLYAPTHREYQTALRARARPRARSPRRSAPTTSCSPARTTSTARTRTCASCTARAACATSPAHPSVEELCLAADVLVTDYSSIMFDYAVLDRPIVIHAPDWEVYRDAPRHLLRPDGRAARASVTRTRGRAGRRASRRAPAGRGRRAVARRVPRALLRARRRPGRRARGAARVARRARAPPPPGPRRSRGERARRAPAGPRRGGGPQRHEPAAGHPRPARLPHPAARGRAPTTRTRAASASRAGRSTSTRACCRQRRVTVNDSRPAALEATARGRRRRATRAELREWLGGAARRARRGRRQGPAHRAGSCRCGRAARPSSACRPSFVTMLRHPSEIARERAQVLRHWQTAASRAAAWINVTLETERATRGAQRAFVRYEDLLADWRARDRPRRASCSTCRRWREPRRGAARRRSTRSSTRRCTATASRWDELDVPARVRDMAEDVWERLQPLADARRRRRGAHAALDAARATSTRCTPRPRRSPSPRSPPPSRAAASRRRAQRRRRAAVAARPRSPAASRRRYRKRLRRALGARCAAPRIAAMPRISVVVPIYNVEALPRATAWSRWPPRRSATSRSSMVDDGSTDGSAAIAEAFAARDPRFRLVTPGQRRPRARRATPASTRRPASSWPSWTPTTSCRRTPTSCCSARSTRPARTSPPATSTGSRRRGTSPGAVPAPRRSPRRG